MNYTGVPAVPSRRVEKMAPTKTNAQVNALAKRLAGIAFKTDPEDGWDACGTYHEEEYLNIARLILPLVEAAEFSVENHEKYNCMNHDPLLVGSCSASDNLKDVLKQFLGEPKDAA